MRLRSLLAGAVAALLLAAPAHGTERVVIGDGHVDIGPRIIDGSWQVRLRDDTVEPPRWRPLSRVVLQARDAARVEVPTDDQFAFLGRAGAPVWILPQVQRDDVLWPGWNTQAPDVVGEVVRDVTWRIHAVRGPGRFVLFANEDFGAPKLLFSSARRLPQDVGIDVDTHAHGNWAFSAAGTYLLDVEMLAVTRSRGPVRARDTLRIFVGDEGPEQAFAVPRPAPREPSGGDAWPLIGAAALLAGLAAVAIARTRRRNPTVVPDR